MSKPIVAPALGFIGVRRGLTCAQFHTVCRILVARKGRGALDGVESVCYSNDGWAGADLARIVRWMKNGPRLIVQEAGRTEEVPPLSTESLASWAEFSLDSETV